MDHWCCPDCGQVQDEASLPILRTKNAVIVDQQTQISYLRGELRKERNAKAKAPDKSPYMADARKVFDHWREQCSPRAREFKDARLLAVLARLRAGYSVDELCKAIDGAAAKPYVVNAKRVPTGRKSERYVELELICRNEANVQKFIALAEDDGTSSTATPSQPAQNGERGSGEVVSREALGIMQRKMTPAVCNRLQELRGWSQEAIERLGLGLDGDRVTIPVRDSQGVLVGLHRYQPNPDKRGNAPKQIAKGKRELFPAPETLDTATCWLVEGEPDGIALTSAGLPAVGVPGVATWKDGWAERFARFDLVYICFDCDREGREAAEKRAQQLHDHVQVQIVDLEPMKDNGYDISDFCRDNPGAVASQLARLAVKRSGGGIVVNLDRAKATHSIPPFDNLVEALERHDFRVQHRTRGHATSQCPNHDDRNPSLSISEGDDGRVLMHCHAGCDPKDICDAIGVPMSELFAA